MNEKKTCLNLNFQQKVFYEIILTGQRQFNIHSIWLLSPSKSEWISTYQRDWGPPFLQSTKCPSGFKLRCWPCRTFLQLSFSLFVSEPDLFNTSRHPDSNKMLILLTDEGGLLDPFSDPSLKRSCQDLSKTEIKFSVGRPPYLQQERTGTERVLAAGTSMGPSSRLKGLSGALGTGHKVRPDSQGRPFRQNSAVCGRSSAW